MIVFGISYPLIFFWHCQQHGKCIQSLTSSRILELSQNILKLEASCGQLCRVHTQLCPSFSTRREKVTQFSNEYSPSAYYCSSLASIGDHRAPSRGLVEASKFLTFFSSHFIKGFRLALGYIRWTDPSLVWDASSQRGRKSIVCGVITMHCRYGLVPLDGSHSSHPSPSWSQVHLYEAESLEPLPYMRISQKTGVSSCRDASYVVPQKQALWIRRTYFRVPSQHVILCLLHQQNQPGEVISSITLWRIWCLRCLQVVGGHTCTIADILASIWVEIVFTLKS